MYTVQIIDKVSKKYLFSSRAKAIDFWRRVKDNLPADAMIYVFPA